MECINGGETLQPFVITEGGRSSILSIVGESVAEQFWIAQRAIDELPTEARVWAFAYDGYLTLDEEKTDAIFIEVGDRSVPEVSVYAQRYAPASPGTKMKLIGSLGRAAKMRSRLQNQQFCGSGKEANQQPQQQRP